jgi:hypothetical protein
MLSRRPGIPTPLTGGASFAGAMGCARREDRSPPLGAEMAKAARVPASSGLAVCDSRCGHAIPNLRHPYDRPSVLGPDGPASSRHSVQPVGHDERAL